MPVWYRNHSTGVLVSPVVPISSYPIHPYRGCPSGWGMVSVGYRIWEVITSVHYSWACLGLENGSLPIVCLIPSMPMTPYMGVGGPIDGIVNSKRLLPIPYLSLIHI